MSEFEQRVRRGLESGAEVEDFDAVQLAAAVRTRSARRGRRRTLAGVAGAVALVALVPVVMTWADDDGGRSPDRSAAAPAPLPIPDGDALPDGWRYEYASGLEFIVPQDWGLGARSDWCLDSRTVAEREPRVDRGEARRAIGCGPTEAYGVTVSSAAAIDFARSSGDVWRYAAEAADVVMHPDGAWLGLWYDDHVALQVAAPDRSTAQRIVGSVQPLLVAIDAKTHEARVTSPTGCQIAVDSSAMTAPSTPPGDGPLTVCRYTTTPNGGVPRGGAPAFSDDLAGDMADEHDGTGTASAVWYLTQSVTLDGAEAGALRTAVAQAPETGSRDCLRKADELVLVSVNGVPTYRIWQPCGSVGVESVDVFKELTPEVLVALQVPVLDLNPRR